MKNFTKVSFSILLILPFFFGFPLIVDPNSLAKAHLFFFCSLFFFLYLTRQANHINFSSVSLWWFGLSAVFLLSAGFSTDPSSVLILSSAMLAAGAFLVVVRQKVLTDEDFLFSSIVALIVVSLLFALLGVYQYHDFLLHGKRPSMLIPSFLPSTGSRVSGPFGQPNFQATVMLIGLCCLAYLYKLRSASLSLLEKSGLGLVSILLLLNFYLANSRAGYVSLLCGFVLLYVYARYRYRSHREYLFTKREVSVTLLLLVGSWGLSWLVGNVIAPLLGDGLIVSQEILRSSSIYNRLNMWVAAVLMAVDYPLLGVGLDNFKTHLAEYQIKAHGLTRFYYEDLLYTRWTHNEYLQILAEGGIVGFVAMIGFLATAGRGIWRNLKTTTTPYFVFVPLALVPLLIHGGFEWPLRFAPLMATFLLLIAISLPVTERGYSFSIASPLRKGILSLACLGFIGLGAWALYWDMEAGVLKRHTGDERLMAHNLERLETLADNPVTALTILRQGMYPYVNRAVRENDVEMARYLVPIFERIIHLEGASWQWFNLSRLQLTAGYLDDARVSVEKAIHLNPIHEPSWQLQHYLNMVNAAEQTGRPIETFFPPQMKQQSFDLIIPEN